MTRDRFPATYGAGRLTGGVPISTDFTPNDATGLYIGGSSDTPTESATYAMSARITTTTAGQGRRRASRTPVVPVSYLPTNGRFATRVADGLTTVPTTEGVFSQGNAGA